MAIQNRRRQGELLTGSPNTNRIRLFSHRRYAWIEDRVGNPP